MSLAPFSRSSEPGLRMVSWGPRRRARSAGRVALLACALMTAAVALPPRVIAQERILSYDSEVQIRADGALDVTERITVRAEGEQIRRGIYRDFPTRYRDRYGNQVRVDFEVVSVERNGAEEPWFTERRPNGVRLNTGNDEFLPVPAEHTFTLRYRTDRQLGFFEDHDELYWNAIGTGWAFPVENGTVRVTLPEPVSPDRLGVEAYTGPQGARGDEYEAEATGPGTAVYRLTDRLAPGEGFTIVLTFPKGIVQEPTTVERLRWLLSDNVGVLVALAGWIGLLAFVVRRWSAVGRDPPRGVIIPRYVPPDGHGPAGLRFMRRMGYDPRCFSGDVLALAVAGRLRIRCDERTFRSDVWALERTDPARERAAADVPSGAVAAQDVLPAQRTLLQGIFATGASIELDAAHQKELHAARTAHQRALEEVYHGRFFRRNVGSLVIAALVAGVTLPLAFALSGGNGVPLIAFVAALMLATLIVFARLVRAPTAEGRKLLDEIEGLALYLGVAERDDLARLPGPQEAPLLDADRYEALLPYAVALEVEDAWTEKFTAAVGAAAAAEAARRITWYRGDAPLTNLGRLTTAVGTDLGGRIASASSPPGSSSGSGGGGFSGGGGGGGGGGGR